ncbi:hypothetical protein ISCGN_006255, partial [Ixodes scapularis]
RRNVIARLTREDADNYDQVKAALLKKHRLSTEAFRQRFRQASRKPSQSWPEFAYNLKADFIEWLKSAGAHGDHDKVVECVATEQFFRELSEAVMFWVQDRLSEPNLMKAAELAEEHAMTRGLQGDSSGKAQRDKEGKKAFWSKKYEVGKPFPRRFASEGYFQKPKEKEVEAADRKVVYQPKPNSEGSKVFEKRRPSISFNCNEPGHFANSCTKKVAFHYVRDSEDNERLLEPYTRQMLVNGKDCRVLRDSAATMDVVHPTYVRPEEYTGDCAWIRQVVEEQSVCLPIAKVSISGPFGVLETEATVSSRLPLPYPYLFSNKSEEMLQQRGLRFANETVLALTRSKA